MKAGAIGRGTGGLRLGLAAAVCLATAASGLRAAPGAAAPASTAAPSVPAPAGPASGASSVLSLGPRGVQTLIVEQLFDRQGRWYLSDDEGVCYTYLESPQVRLAPGRLVLKAHLVSRLGQRIGGSCVGTDLQSDVAVSGKVRGAGHQLILDDIRIDRVDDEAVRGALQLALQVNSDVIPRTARIDVLESLRRQAFTSGAIAVHVDEIRIAGISTRSDNLVIQFDLTLSAP